jgi:putative cell wall-binding protein
MGKDEYIFKVKEDPDYWHNRAEEARMVMEATEDSAAKATMRKIAESYDLLALKAMERKNLRSVIDNAKQDIEHAKRTIAEAEKKLENGNGFDHVFQAVKNVVSIK